MIGYFLWTTLWPFLAVLLLTGVGFLLRRWLTVYCPVCKRSVLGPWSAQCLGWDAVQDEGSLTGLKCGRCGAYMYPSISKHWHYPRVAAAGAQRRSEQVTRVEAEQLQLLQWNTRAEAYNQAYLQSGPRKERP